MLRITLISTIIFLISCRQGEKGNIDSSAKTPQQTVLDKSDKTRKALEFINGYVENWNKGSARANTVEWINSNNMTTENFKNELKKILDEAYKEEPEVGLDFDPILDAQDGPEKGFDLDNFDETTNYLIVRGKDWPEFKLTMKITENGGWLVDGCGIVNVPIEKRSAR
jgi:hypothetical protein